MCSEPTTAVLAASAAFLPSAASFQRSKHVLYRRSNVLACRELLRLATAVLHPADVHLKTFDKQGLLSSIEAGERLKWC
jgi:hypothetical protein